MKRPLEEEDAGVAPRTFLQSESAGNRQHTLTSKDKKAITSLHKKLVNQENEQKQLLRIAYILNLQVDDTPGSGSIKKALHSALSPADTLKSLAKETPVGKLKSLVCQYYFDDKYSFSGDEEDLGGYDYSEQHNHNINFVAPRFMWTKGGLSLQPMQQPVNPNPPPLLSS